MADDILTVTSVFQLPPQAAENELALVLWCDRAVSTGERQIMYENLGLIELPFYIEDTQTTVKRAEPGTFFNEKPIEITQAELNPGILQIRSEINTGDFPSDLDFEMYADDTLLTADSDGARLSYLDYLMGDMDGKMAGLILVPFADNTISRVTLIPYTRDTEEILGEDAVHLIFQ